VGIFEDGVDVLFESDAFAALAEYRCGGAGVGQPVRIVRRQPDELLEGFEASRLRRPTCRIDVRISECPTIADGDTFTVIAGDQTALVDPTTRREIVFVVDGAPVRSDDRTLWICGCREVGE